MVELKQYILFMVNFFDAVNSSVCIVTNGRVSDGL
jgi:hypothetical protein